MNTPVWRGGFTYGKEATYDNGDFASADQTSKHRQSDHEGLAALFFRTASGILFHRFQLSAAIRHSDRLQEL